MTFSIIIPLFNRPDEINELLHSLNLQEEKETFEVIIVEDGSSIDAKEIVNSFSSQLNITYLCKENGGPSLARNYGAETAKGEWLVFLDSDCVLPHGWMTAMTKGVNENLDLAGGADRASDSFSSIQKAINYSMTSPFTTGGIRGSKRSMEKFHPRSFNMAIRRSTFNKAGGFSSMRFGEDIDLSIRLMKIGARSTYLPDAWVYHKRRVDFRKFYRQVRASGTARIALTKKHPGSLRLVHFLPFAFTLYLFLAIISAPFCPMLLLPLLFWLVIIFADSTWQNKSIKVGFLSEVASVIQLSGYGIGFIWALCGGGKTADKNFYK